MAFFIFSIIWLCAMFSIELFLAIFISQKINSLLTNINDSNYLHGNLELFIIICLILLIGLIIFNVLNLISMLKIKNSDFNKKDFIILSCISLNLIALIYWSLKNSDFKNDNKIMKTFVSLNNSNKFLLNKSVFILTTYDIIVIGLMIGLYFALDYITYLFIPPMPFWITVSIKYVPLFFLAWIMSWFHTFITLLIVVCLEWLMPGTYVIFPIQYLFDYGFPVLSLCLVSILRDDSFRLSFFLKTINWILIISVVALIIYISRVISGVLFYSAAKWNGFNAWTYSIVLNGFNSIVDYFSLQILVPIVCTALQVVKIKYKSYRYAKFSKYINLEKLQNENLLYYDDSKKI
ncbi:energy-coupled thiamine transporter ThiT [Spiroplasma endosymbiont of Labia minor]|uniref:energy-coupled thiamine transporter ThiT n=1 Tax=Spiroplasma endosymbiont of Labia minor TaxID=3066305 RepID=UPI0030D5275A